MTDSSLLTKYRPTCFEEVIGQDAIVASLFNALKKRSSHAFLFIGPSGVGKTTLARLAAKQLGCQPLDLIEIDGASNTGIDAMREVAADLPYMPLGEGSIKAVICDECFVEGTLIDTPDGPRPIENLRCGELVIGAFGPVRIKRTFNKKTSTRNLIKLLFSGGRSIICTQDHKFLTLKGWIPAKGLHGVYSSQNLSVGEIQTYLQEVWDPIYEQRSQNVLLCRLLGENLCELWQKVLGTWRTSLFSGLWRCCNWKQASQQTPVYFSSGSSACWDSSQPQTAPGSLGSHSFLNIEANETITHLGDAWSGEWKGANKTAKITSLFGRWLFGTCNYYWKVSWGRWLAFKLQSRYWLSRSEAWGGGGWRFTYASKRASNRFETRCSPKKIRVENLTVAEQRDLSRSKESCKNGEDFIEVFDLEIEGHPSYSVEGQIVHNCHMLSKSAWASLLKIVESPPNHVYWFLCTTEAGKVPAAIKTRCLSYELKAVPSQTLAEFLDDIVSEEKLKVADGVLTLCAKEAKGSPRQALANLAVCATAKTKAEAAELLASAEESAAAINLARALYQGAGWSELVKIIAGLNTENPESVRHVIRAYGTSMLLKSAKGTQNTLAVLEAFGTPFNSSDGVTPLLLACGRLTQS